MKRDKGGGPGAQTNQPAFFSCCRSPFPVLLHLMGVLSKKDPSNHEVRSPCTTQLEKMGNLNPETEEQVLP